MNLKSNVALLSVVVLEFGSIAGPIAFAEPEQNVSALSQIGAGYGSASEAPELQKLAVSDPVQERLAADWQAMLDKHCNESAYARNPELKEDCAKLGADVNAGVSDANGSVAEFWAAMNKRFEGRPDPQFSRQKFEEFKSSIETAVASYCSKERLKDHPDDERGCSELKRQKITLIVQDNPVSNVVTAPAAAMGFALSGPMGEYWGTWEDQHNRQWWLTLLMAFGDTVTIIPRTGWHWAKKGFYYERDAEAMVSLQDRGKYRAENDATPIEYVLPPICFVWGGLVGFIGIGATMYGYGVATIQLFDLNVGYGGPDPRRAEKECLIGPDGKIDKSTCRKKKF